MLSDVYAPTVDNTNVETLQYAVTDGSTFTDLQTRDMTYTVSALDPTGMSCRVTSTPRRGGYTLVTDYLTDPQRDSVVMQTRLQGPGSLKLYVRYDATVNGNGGGGAGQRRRRRRDRRPGHHRAGQLGHQHGHQRGEPGLRRAAVRRARGPTGRS